MSTLSPLIASSLSPLARAMPAPDRIDVSADQATLQLMWPAQPTITVTAGALRTACKCAHCIRARYDGRFPDRIDDDVLIAEVSPMGNFGVNIAFSDGHARGIYPWPYLAEIASSAGTVVADEA